MDKEKAKKFLHSIGEKAMIIGGVIVFGLLVWMTINHAPKLGQSEEQTPEVVVAEEEEQEGSNVVRWVIPEGTRRVTVTLYQKNGTYINEYEISRYITLRPGMRIKIEAE